jgi:hypothetical protein
MAVETCCELADEFGVSGFSRISEGFMWVRVENGLTYTCPSSSKAR